MLCFRKHKIFLLYLFILKTISNVTLASGICYQMTLSYHLYIRLVAGRLDEIYAPLLPFINFNEKNERKRMRNKIAYFCQSVNCR